MGCEKLRQGLIQNCEPVPMKYFQQVVLVNREDVNQSLILTSFTDLSDNYTCRHRVTFDLKENKTGYKFSIAKNAASIYAKFDKSEVEDIPQYTHNIYIVVSGITEDIKCLLKQLDSGDYFAAIQGMDGTVEIYGFEYGLTTSNYSYDIQNNGGASIITLKSKNDSPEDEPPFIYAGEPTDFDNDFADNIFNPSGDFNNDFNDDFYNI